MEINESTLLLIIGGYVVAGVLSLVMAATGLGGRGNGARILNAVIGVACIGYAGYLLFSTSESVFVFWYAMFLPLIVLFRALRERREARQTA